MIAMTYGNSLSLKRWVTAGLVMVAYFFLLRVREYTPTTTKKGSAKQTIPLQKQDITFWHNTHTIPTDSPVERLQQADGVTINLANQKNGAKDAKVSHSQSGDKTLCPCRSLAHLVAELRDFLADTPIGMYRTATEHQLKWPQYVIINGWTPTAQLHKVITNRFCLQGTSPLYPSVSLLGSACFSSP
jgi:hypothetical protein